MDSFKRFKSNVATSSRSDTSYDKMFIIILVDTMLKHLPSEDPSETISYTLYIKLMCHLNVTDFFI